MDILFVTPEVAPLSGSGPAAAFCGALPKALRSLEHRVTVVSPLYAHIDPTRRNLARRLTKLEFELDGQPHACELYDGRTPGGVDLLFIGHEELFHRVESFEPEGEDPRQQARRAGVFACAVEQLLRTREPRFELVHAHGWPGAVAVMIAASRDDLEVPLVLTVHDANDQGVFDPELAACLGLPERMRGPEGAAHEGRLNPLKGGLLHADRVTTVSPGYAREITEPGGGAGLERVLGELGEHLVGIPNGVDVSIWNPATDAHLLARFDPMDRTGKARCKSALQQELGLPVRDDVPLFGAVGTTHPDEGLDLLAKCGPPFLRNDVQLALQLEGDPELIGRFEDLSRRWPDRLQVRAGARAELTHRIIAAADLLVVPARQAASVLVHKYAHRYGALPVARRTGGLADAIVDCEPSLKTGSGFLFDEPTPDALLSAMQRAVGAWLQRDVFDALGQRVMRIDHSWERSARLYERLYRHLVKG